MEFQCIKCHKIKNRKNLNSFDFICAECRRKENMLKKYGVENPAQLQSVKDKIKSTNLQRYGATVAAKNDKVRNKMKATLLERYDNKLPGQKASHDRFLRDRLKECEQADLEWLDSNEFRGKYDDAPIQYHFKCKKCGNIFVDNFHSLPFPVCRKCHPNWHNTSKQEKEIVEFIRQHYNGEVIENDRKALGGKELDILIPDNSIAVEFNGTYWHGYRKDLGVSLEKYLIKHQEKRLLCNEKGIHLITIDEIDYDDELLKFVVDMILGNDVSEFEKKHKNDLRYFPGTKSIECRCRGFMHKKIVPVNDLEKFINNGGIAIFDLGLKL